MPNHSRRMVVTKVVKYKYAIWVKGGRGNKEGRKRGVY